jgi:glycosyltransferase involved in cell wall biosynthesis
MDSAVSPKVTVAIPLYNQEKFIKQTIQSILDQSYQDFEIQVYDDLSSDKSRDLVREFHDSRISLVESTERLGPEKNWNRCLSQIHGEFFVLLPGDDFLEKDYLQKMLRVFEKDIEQKIALVGCSRKIVNSEGKVLSTRGFRGAEGIHGQAEILKKTFLYGTNIIGEPGSGMVRSKFARQVGTYRARPGYMIDLDFWVRVLNYGKYYYLDEPLVSFRISDNSWSSRIGFQQRRQFLEFISHVTLEQKLTPTFMEKFAASASSFVNLVGRMVFFKLWA